MGNTKPEPSRIASLDQFRGYTVLGMFWVNFIGGFDAIKDQFPVFKHHNTYCSYADTIMPQFFFAVGFALRLTFLRRLQTDGVAAATAKVVRRCLGLLLVAFVVYNLGGGIRHWSELAELGTAIENAAHVPFQVESWSAVAPLPAWQVISGELKRNLFQTLAHIAVTSLWVLPVIAGPAWLRLVYAVASGALHLYLSHRFNYAWVNANPVGIDGGPLGFLTWTIPLLLGSLAYDAVAASVERPPVLRLFGWGCVVMAVGYAIACINLVTPPNVASGDWSSYLVEPPFFPPSRPVNLWTMSQRSGSVSYLTFAAGFSLSLYALFVYACDVHGWRLGMLATLGGNALAGYIIHDLVGAAVKPFVPKDAPLWYVVAAFAVFFGICYLFLRYLEKQRMFLRL